jgi:N-acetylneuraminate synthase
VKFDQVFIIAEISGNHKGSLSRAMELVDAAAEAGVSAIKLQTYTPDTMTLNFSHGEFLVSDPESLWFGRSLYDLYSEGTTPWDWHEQIFEHAANLGLIGFSTPFDLSAVQFLESLNVPIYKIASFELTYKQLIERVAETGKDLILSTGMANLKQIEKSVDWFKCKSKSNLTLLKCTSSYPAPYSEVNLKAMVRFKEIFNTNYGLSDHTAGEIASVAAVALGATVIEKHITLDKKDGAIDSAFSLDPQQFKSLVNSINQVKDILGKVSFGIGESEFQSSIHRRSIYFVRDLLLGQIIEESDLRIIRPGLGLEPEFLDQIVGKKTQVNIKAGTPTSTANIDFA